MEKKGFFAKIREGLKKTREQWFGDVFAEDRINDEFYEELEEALILADTGVETTASLITELKKRVKQENRKTRPEAKELLENIISEILEPHEPFAADEGPAVILIVGVNGVGKTTSIGKIAYSYITEKRKPMLAAADTFRAAAAEQLGEWAERAGVPMVKHQEGSDPAAVVFDSIASYKAKNCDLLIIDTAGRLHNKSNLMKELNKIRRVIEKELGTVPCETLLVLDATTGQNATSQAKAFMEASELTGVILTKLDGTAKGGVVINIADTLHVPVRFIGVGEGIEDMKRFDPSDFAKALF